MTATTSSKSSRSALVPLIGLVLIGLVVAIAFFGQDEAAVGGAADADGTGPDGFFALRLLIEESGSDTIRNVGLPTDDIDVAILAFGPVAPFVVGGTDAPPEPTWEPLHDWIRAGGTLITAVDVEGGPAGGDIEDDEDAVIARGICTIPELDGVAELRPRTYQQVIAINDDTQCFGGATGSVVVSRPFGEGRIIRLGSIGPFTNRALDDADNGAFAARIIGLETSPTVGFLSRSPVFFEQDSDGEISRDPDGNPIEQLSPFDSDQPLDADGNPIGSGDSGLLQLVPRSVIALVLALAASLLLYVIARARRLGSVIEEPLPIELPSSSYVEAVGRSFGRVENAPGRSAAILRHDLRVEIARRVGLPAETPTGELAQAFSGDQSLVALLDGHVDVDEDQLVAAAQQLTETRSRMERGGVSVLTPTESFTAPRSQHSRSDDATSTGRKDMS